MKITLREASIDYSQYLFGYAQFCEQESHDNLSEIYDNGFLPYSGDVTEEINRFYMARSLRIDLANFVDSSENRRVNRKVEPLGIALDMISKDQALTDPDILPFCRTYAEERIGASMPSERLTYVFQKPLATHVFRFNKEGHQIGYILAVISDQMMHYWFSFFSLDLLGNYPIGKWMMWQAIRWAKDNGKSFVYLGTCYGTKSLYKARDFKGMQFFDGNGWNGDLATLKGLCKSDDL